MNTEESQLAVGQGLDSTLGDYTSKILQWHEVAFRKFGAKEAVNYLTNPLLIASELEETLKGFEDCHPNNLLGNPWEVIDGLLDVYWEVTPVYNFLKGSTQLVTYLGMEPLPFAGDHAILHLNNSLTLVNNLRIDYYNFSAQVVALIMRIHSLVESILHLISLHTGIRFIEEAINMVVKSNFSKFHLVEIDGETNEHCPDVSEEVAYLKDKYSVGHIIFKSADIWSKEKVYLTFRTFYLPDGNKLIKPRSFEAPNPEALEPFLTQNSQGVKSFKELKQVLHVIGSYAGDARIAKIKNILES